MQFAFTRAFVIGHWDLVIGHSCFVIRHFSTADASTVWHPTPQTVKLIAAAGWHFPC